MPVMLLRSEVSGLDPQSPGVGAWYGMVSQASLSKPASWDTVVAFGNLGWTGRESVCQKSYYFSKTKNKSRSPVPLAAQVQGWAGWGRLALGGEVKGGCLGLDGGFRSLLSLPGWGEGLEVRVLRAMVKPG